MKFIAVLLSFCFGLALTGCNTMEGVGEDVGAAGNAIEDSAQENKNY